jgi:hypothetical protein
VTLERVVNDRSAPPPPGRPITKSGGVTSGKGDWAWLALHPTGPVADPTQAVRVVPRSAHVCPMGSLRVAADGLA